MLAGKIRGPWIWFGIIILLLLASCAYYEPGTGPGSSIAAHKHNVIRKSYSRPPLTRYELEELIELTVYTGQPEYYGDVLFAQHNGSRKFKPVVFSHQLHRQRFSCSLCHTELEFSFTRGETGVTRDDYLNGRYCGACHDGTTAFATESACDRCHRDIDPERQDYPPLAANLIKAGLPATTYGDRIDWNAAVAAGAIHPLKELPDYPAGPGMPLPRHLQDEPLYWTTAAPHIVVRFPHNEHLNWLDCSNCHPDLFSIKQTGTVAFDKQSNLYGEYCGVCHMTVAFPMDGCNRCHPTVKNYAGKKL
ncbi:MAG: hypothetical protein C0622_12100 [Desulfuromonas sp.]|nr:MAG: hypothetical protein C0622_12100 [Desulfuromonas sp.]